MPLKAQRSSVVSGLRAQQSVAPRRWEQRGGFAVGDLGPGTGTILGRHEVLAGPRTEAAGSMAPSTVVAPRRDKRRCFRCILGLARTGCCLVRDEGEDVTRRG